MSRWMSVKTLESYEVSLYEQALFVAKGLPAYNSIGMRVIERKNGESIPYGCVYLSSDYGPCGGGEITYFRWLDVPDELRDLKYKTDELVSFLLSEQKKPGIKKIIDLLPASLFENSIVNYQEKFISSQEEIKELKNEIETLTNKLNNLLNVSLPQNTEPAIRSRQEKAIKNWALTVEKAVSLAVACARNGKPKSKEQHKHMWRSFWNEDGDGLPRRDGFDAFRRGLPNELKGKA